jgi:hypothetical protein
MGVETLLIVKIMLLYYIKPLLSKKLIEILPARGSL